MNLQIEYSIRVISELTLDKIIINSNFIMGTTTLAYPLAPFLVFDLCLCLEKCDFDQIRCYHCMRLDMYYDFMQEKQALS